MLKKTLAAAGLAVTASVLVAGPALAAVTFHPATGTGFVGKGDVQLALGLNNKQLQEQAGDLEFTFNATSVSQTSWTCENDRNEKVQERRRTTTSQTYALVDFTARERNQVTGFALTGFSGPVVATTGETEGPKLHSCPSDKSGFVFGSEQTTTEVTDGGLHVNGVRLP